MSLSTDMCSRDVLVNCFSLSENDHPSVLAQELEKLQERQKMTNELRLQQSGEIEARQLAVEKQVTTDSILDLESPDLDSLFSTFIDLI